MRSAKLHFINEHDHYADYAEPAHFEHTQDGPVEKWLRKDSAEPWAFKIALITLCVFLTLWVTRYWR